MCATVALGQRWRDTHLAAATLLDSWATQELGLLSRLGVPVGIDALLFPVQ